MLKYFLILVLAATSTVQAGCFYAGGSLGVSALRAEKHHTILNSADIVLKSENHDLGVFGFVGGGFIGYNLYDDCFCQNWDCGLEVFGNGYTSEAKATHNTASTVTVASKLKVSQEYNCGARILPGYRLYDQVGIHFIAGYTFGGFKLRDNGVYGEASKRFTSNGYQVGAGTTFGLCNGFSLRLDVVYNGYPSHHRVVGNAPSAVQGGPTGGATTRYRIKTSSVDSTLSLAYGF